MNQNELEDPFHVDNIVIKESKKIGYKKICKNVCFCLCCLLILLLMNYFSFCFGIIYYQRNDGSFSDEYII